jgi:predicted dehydrogenase
MQLPNEEGPRLRVALVGCGAHAYRNVLPALDLVPVDLVATCDQHRSRAEKYAVHFGAEAAYTSLKDVIERGDVDAVLLVVGEKRHPDLACEALAGGLHVWMEKPPAPDVAGVDKMIAARDAAGKNVVVGFKKAFMPGLARMKSFVDSHKFGAIRTIAGRFPMDIPADGPKALSEGRFTNWIGNGIHPLSALVHLGGRPDSVTVHRSPLGGGFVILTFPSGAVASLHLAEGQSMSGALERYEVVCENGHMVLENNIRLTVHQPGYPFDYASGRDFTEGAPNVAALVYEPQWTLATLENKSIVLQGFVGELEHFVNACLKGTKPTSGTLEFARAVMECYEAGLLSQGQPIKLDDLERWKRKGA